MGAAIAHGHAVFGILPEQFWAMPVREWRLLQHPGGAHANGAALRGLMREFPDMQEDKSDEHS